MLGIGRAPERGPEPEPKPRVSIVQEVFGVSLREEVDLCNVSIKGTQVSIA